jgi:two-component system chemotaxis response regulator CheB
MHLQVQPDRRFTYVNGARVRGMLSSTDPLFTSATEVFEPRAIGVVLTGSTFAATDGVQAVKARGGIVIAHEPVTARYPSMPASAVRSGALDHVLPLEAIASDLVAIAQGQQVEKTAMN